MKFGNWLGLVVLLVSLYILWKIHQVLLLAFTAVVLASALNGLVRKLMQWRLKRGWAVMLSIALLVGATLLFGLLVIPPFIAESQQLPELLPQSLERISDWANGLRSQPFIKTLPPEVFTSLNNTLNNLSNEIPKVATRLVGQVIEIFSSSLLVLLNILLIFVLMIMLLMEPDKYQRMFIRMFPAFYRRRVKDILDQCDVAIDNWIVGILFNMSIIAICSGLGLWLLGVRLVLANALIAGLLEAIPNIGPTLSLIPPMAIALIDQPWKALAVLVLYVMIQQLEQYLLVPTVMAKQLDLPPAVTLLSQIIFAFFFGFLGLLLALPLVIVGQIWLKEVLIKDVLDEWQSSSTT